MYKDPRNTGFVPFVSKRWSDTTNSRKVLFMKKLILTALLALTFAAPAFAVEATATTTTTATVTTTDTAAAAKEACTKETNEKVKLPENAGDAEKAQWDAAFAECVKGKGLEEAAAPAAVAPVETTTTTTTATTTDAAPAVVDPEAAGDAADVKAAQ